MCHWFHCVLNINKRRQSQSYQSKQNQIDICFVYLLSLFYLDMVQSEESNEEEKEIYRETAHGIRREELLGMEDKEAEMTEEEDTAKKKSQVESFPEENKEGNIPIEETSILHTV